MIWNDLWHTQVPLLEKVLRTALVYGGLAVLLRLAGKRDLAQLNSFDLVVMLLLSNVVQNAVIGSDNSLAGGLFGAAVLVAINAVTVRLANRHPKLIRFFEGAPTTLVKDGEVITQAVNRLGMRSGDVAAACRRQGADHLSDIQEATLWPGGSIVVTLVEQHRNATVADLRTSNAELLAQVRTELAHTTEDLERRLSQQK